MRVVTDTRNRGACNFIRDRDCNKSGIKTTTSGSYPSICNISYNKREGATIIIKLFFLIILYACSNLNYDKKPIVSAQIIYTQLPRNTCKRNSIYSPAPEYYAPGCYELNVLLILIIIWSYFFIETSRKNRFFLFFRFSNGIQIAIAIAIVVNVALRWD